MEKDNKNGTLEQLRKAQPFRVPEGYMENLTNRIMKGLPKTVEVEAESVSLLDRIRPWFYLAAVFLGLGLFFKVIVGLDTVQNQVAGDSLLVRSEVPTSAFEAIDAETAQEDADYLEYIERQYADYLLKESLTESE